MIVLELCVVVLLIGLTAAVVLGKFGASMPEPVSSHRHEPLPDGDLLRSDIDQLRFDRGLRGYRMDEVDAVIERLTDELDHRDQRISWLQARLGSDHVMATDPEDDEG